MLCFQGSPKLGNSENVIAFKPEVRLLQLLLSLVSSHG